MEDSIKKIQREFENKILKSKTLKDLDEIFLALFGKNGEITLLPKEFSKLSKEDLKVVGPLFNLAKQNLEKAIEERRSQIREENYKKLEKEKFTFKPQGLEAKKRQGHLHLATQFKKEIIDLFGKLGFEQFDAPHIELDKYNFEYLNIPIDHPSRDMWDTLYVLTQSKGKVLQASSKISHTASEAGPYIDTLNLKVEPGSLLLRTHTSNFWPRLMEKGKTPIRAMSFDRCFRYEAVDVRHSHTFNQFEIAVVSGNVSMANLKYLSDYFLKAILGKEAKSRFRPKYYPFVEPGVGIDSLCVFCHGKGCRICAGTGWFEIAGAGMIHPNVFKATGLDPAKYTGLAWGFGPDRMLMLKHGIEDIRYFLEGNLEFLQKF